MLVLRAFLLAVLQECLLVIWLKRDNRSLGHFGETVCLCFLILHWQLKIDKWRRGFGKRVVVTDIAFWGECGRCTGGGLIVGRDLPAALAGFLCRGRIVLPGLSAACRPPEWPRFTHTQRRPAGGWLTSPFPLIFKKRMSNWSELSWVCFYSINLWNEIAYTCF